MRKAFLAPAILALLLTTSAAPADKHVKADLAPNGATGVTGFVQITQLPKGGSVVNVQARGLEPGKVYASFYYESSDCSAGHDLLATFTAAADGTGEAQGKIDDDLDEVGSVSVRVGPDYGDLLACAKIH